MRLLQEGLQKVPGGPSARPPLGGGVQYGRGRPSRSRWPWRLIGASVAAVALLFFVVKVPGLLLGRRLPAKPVRSVPAAQTGAQPPAPPAVSPSASSGQSPVEPPAVSPAEPPSSSLPAGAAASSSSPSAARGEHGRTAHRVPPAGTAVNPPEAPPPTRAPLPIPEERVAPPVQVGPPDSR